MDHEQELKSILSQNKLLAQILEKAVTLALPNWYLGAGAVAQTVWNHKNRTELNHGIEDYDLVYFDPDISQQAQDRYIARARMLFGDLPVEIVNQARVHLWYPELFAKDIRPYSSTESAIDTWPTTATSVGVTMDENGETKVYAPYGLEDLLNLTVRANKLLIGKEVYEQKVEKWTGVWPNLKVVPW